jgi:sugar phosphate isomerase/epimerase
MSVNTEPKYPKICLAIDNCFAYKRWTRPEEWCDVIAGLGIQYAEASADNELDPLYMGPEYLARWVEAVRKAQRAAGIRVANLYSGHSTYTTLGLTHTDEGVRRRLIELWFKPMIAIAGALDAGFGFFAHAFPHEALQNAALYQETVEILTRGLIELNQYALSRGCGKMGIEQMYSPHQYPWTISGTRELIRGVTQKSGSSFYFTEDLGHHRSVFQKPDGPRLNGICGKRKRGAWLGSDRAFALAEAGDLPSVREELALTGHLFEEQKDGDCYAWLRELGAYSPIIHLQQTNGRCSSHLPFTAENNAWGIIDGGRVLQALKAAYDKPMEEMPAKCETIYLTLELFAETGVIMRDFMDDLRESVSYWRQWIPRDGMYLDELVSRADAGGAP